MKVVRLAAEKKTELLTKEQDQEYDELWSDSLKIDREITWKSPQDEAKELFLDKGYMQAKKLLSDAQRF